MGDGSQDSREAGGGRKKLADEPEREFLFRLALQLGIWDVEALADSMPLPMFYDWLAFYRMSPWGDEWRRAGRLARIIALANGAKGVEDLEDNFMPGGGRYRGMNQSEIEMLKELKKIPQVQQRFENKR